MCQAAHQETRCNNVFPSTRPSLSMRHNRFTSKQEPRVSATLTRRGIHQPDINGGRRCQSAQTRRADRQHQIRSHSQEPQASTDMLPIPQAGRSDPSQSHVERTDLTRMYDYATWNMYERIVNARKQRLSLLGAQQKIDKGSTATSPTAETTSVENPKAVITGGMVKAHSRESSSLTSSTLDEGESDRSSATISSAGSISASLLSAGIKRTMFSLGAIKADQESQDNHLEKDSEEQEHFIFEMDM